MYIPISTGKSFIMVPVHDIQISDNTEIFLAILAGAFLVAAIFLAIKVFRD